MTEEAVITTVTVPGEQSYDLPPSVKSVKRLWMGGNRLRFSFDKYKHRLYIFQVPMREQELKALVIEDPWLKSARPANNQPKP